MPSNPDRGCKLSVHRASGIGIWHLFFPLAFTVSLKVGKKPPYSTLVISIAGPRHWPVVGISHHDYQSGHSVSTQHEAPGDCLKRATYREIMFAQWPVASGWSTRQAVKGESVFDIFKYGNNNHQFLRRMQSHCPLLADGEASFVIISTYIKGNSMKIWW